MHVSADFFLALKSDKTLVCSLEEFAGEHDISALMGAEEQEGLRVSLEQQEQAALDARANAGASAAVSAPATKPEPAAEAVAPAAVQVKPEADAAGAADVKAEDAMEGVHTEGMVKPAADGADEGPAAAVDVPASAEAASAAAVDLPAAVPNGDIQPDAQPEAAPGDTDMADADADADVEAPPGKSSATSRL